MKIKDIITVRENKRNNWIDRSMDRWTDRWMRRWIAEHMNMEIDKGLNDESDRQIYEQSYYFIDQLIEKQNNRQTDR